MKRSHEEMNNTTGSEYVYYNYNVVNTKTESVPCEFSETLTGAILNNGKKYFVTAVRFVLDGSSIPMFYFKDSTYYVTLTWNGFVGQAPVVYTPFQDTHNENTVYSITAFLEMINAAFATAVGDLVTNSSGAFPPLGGPTNDPPFMLFDAATGLISLYAQTLYATFITPTKIFMNTPLYQFFTNFMVQFNGENLASKQDYEILLRNLKFNTITVPNLTGTYYKMTQEYNSIFNWFDITGIIFASNALGVVSEYLPVQNTTSNLVTNNSAGAGPSSTPMVTDFQPYLAPGDSAGIRGYLYYAPNSQWRFINLTQDIIRKFDITVKLRDKLGGEHIYYLPPNVSFQMKLAFVERGQHTT